MDSLAGEQVIQELAISLRSVKGASATNKVNALIARCPGDVVDGRSLAALLALCDFLAESQQNAQEIVPVLVRTLKAMDRLRVETTAGDDVMKIQAFGQAFICGAAKVAAVIEDSALKMAIIGVIELLCDSLQRRGGGTVDPTVQPLLIGVLRGVGEQAIPFTLNELNNLVNTLYRNVTASTARGADQMCKAAALRTYVRLSYLKDFKSLGVINKLFETAKALLSGELDDLDEQSARRRAGAGASPYEDNGRVKSMAFDAQTSPDGQKDLILRSITLVARIGITTPAFTNQALAHLCDILTDENHGDVPGDVSDIFCTVIQALEGFASSAAVPQILEALQVFVTSDKSFFAKSEDNKAVSLLIDQIVSCLSKFAQSKEVPNDLSAFIASLGSSLISMQQTIRRLSATPTPMARRAAFASSQPEPVLSDDSDDHARSVGGIARIGGALAAMSMAHLAASNSSGTPPAVPANAADARVSERHVRAALRIIQVLGKLACVCGAEASTTIMPILTRSLCVPPFSLDSALVEQMTEIALRGDPATFRFVMEDFTSKTGHAADPNTAGVAEAVENSYLQIARGLKPQLRDEFHGVMMKVFLRMAKGVRERLQKDKTAQLTSQSFKLGFLLPVIAEVYQHLPLSSIMQPGSKLLWYHQNAWGYMVLFDFVNEGLINAEWEGAVKQLAVSGPVLVSSTAKLGYVEAETAFKSIAQGVPEQRLRDIQASLLTLLPAHSAAIRQMSFGQSLFLYSVYHLESLRAQNRCPRTIFSYLGALDFETSRSPLCRPVASICDMAMELYVKNVASKPIDAATEVALEEEMCFLLANYAHHTTRIRQAADKYIAAFTARFPQLMYSTSCLKMLLHVLEAVTLSCAPDSMTPADKELVNGAGGFPSLFLPEDPLSCRRVLNDCVRLCEVWLAGALRSAPVATHSALHQIFQNFRQLRVRFPNEIGLAISVGSRPIDNDPSGMMTSYLTRMILPQAPEDSNPGGMGSYRNSSAFVAELELKAGYIGEINGMKSALAKSGQSVEDFLVAELAAINQSLDRGVSVRLEDASDALYRAAAFIAQSESVSADLVELVCWTPIHFWTATALNLATVLWTWLLNRPDAEDLVYAKLQYFWDWTIESHWGLFGASLEKSPYRDSVPHDIWLSFLNERFLNFSRSPKLISIVATMVQKGLSDLRNLSADRQDMSARFRFYILTARLLQSGWTPQDVSTLIVRDRFYNCGLGYFTRPSKFRHSPASVMREEIVVVTEFVKLLRADKPPANSAEEGQEFKPLLASLRRRRTVLLLFVLHELENLRVWLEPLKAAGAREPEFSQVDQGKDKKLGDLVSAAWRVSPRVAIQFAIRFPNCTEYVAKHVRDEPLSVVYLPEAVKFLVSEQTVGSNDPALHHLLYWAACDPPTCLELLSKPCRAHPAVAQYITRVLRSFTPETVIFYIPQLVQVLRHDEHGYVEQYLEDASRNSYVVCHQVLWNARIYCAKHEDSNEYKHPALARIVIGLRDRILATLQPQDRQFYENEFKIFDDITAISGKLKPLKGKPEAQSALMKEELRAIAKRMEGFNTLYLPSNVSATVVKIDTESGAVMRSAAKVPIMVTFGCIEGDVNHAPLETLATPVPDDDFREQSWSSDEDSRPMSPAIEHTDPAAGVFAPMPQRVPRLAFNLSGGLNDTPRSSVRLDDVRLEANTSTPTLPDAKKEKQPVEEKNPPGYTRKSCIFKVGDDVRQDMLALQITETFRRAYQAADMPLYCFPYRVVATDDDNGIIECVPNTKSRDQLGRATDLYLNDYFLQTYGDIDSLEYQRARMNFIESAAAYSVVCYILNIKDRHNGNILIDKVGHMVHIDFGFIFDISPGGNMHFERAPFKMTWEYLELMGGSTSTELFLLFKELCVKAYLTVRPCMPEVIALVSLLVESGLPCFDPKVFSMKGLMERFSPSMTAREAALHMGNMVMSAVSSFTTDKYDLVQSAQQGVWYKPKDLA